LRVTPIPDLGRSWWLREALALPGFAGDPAPPLHADITADVVILGGGYTGMWTAWFLKERDPGIDVVLLEQDICGGGPSGRNGGFCDGWWGHVVDLATTFGDDGARALLEAVAPSPSEIGAWCVAHGIDAWFRDGGDLAVATNPHHEGRWSSTIRTAERLGIARHYRELDADQVRARCASPTFRGGLLIPDGATVQPARLARGLRRVLMERGVRICEGTPVSRFGAGSPTIAETPGGTVRAAHAVNALGAWATTWRRFRPVLTIRGSFIVITEPVPDRVEALGWTGGEAIRDLRSSVHYLRTTPDGRIAFGLGGLQRGLARQVGASMAFDEGFLRKTADDLVQMFPTFADVPIAAGWGGPINVSGLTMPFFGTTGTRANVHHGLGYTGNGVGPSHLGGKILAALATGADDALARLPVVTREPKRFPPEPLRSPGMLVANAAIWRKDDLEDAGVGADPLTRLVATMPRRLGYNLGPR
jgi:glycine/D-amino acid oxidase-like deaminating enzyme